MTNLHTKATPKPEASTISAPLLWRDVFQILSAVSMALHFAFCLWWAFTPVLLRRNQFIALTIGPFLLVAIFGFLGHRSWPARVSWFFSLCLWYLFGGIVLVAIGLSTGDYGK